MLRDTVFRWSHCNIEKSIDRYGSPSLFTLSLKKTTSHESMNSRTFRFADHKSPIQKIRDSDRDCMRAYIYSIYIYIYIYIYVFKYVTEIHDQYKIFSKTLSSKHLQAHFPIIDDRTKLCSPSFTCPSSSRKVSDQFLNKFVLQMIFVRRIELFELFFMIYDNYLYDWMSKRIEDPRVIHHQKTMFYESCSISIRDSEDVLMNVTIIIISMKVSLVLFTCVYFRKHWI